MSEYSGSLPSIEIALALWLAPLAPLVAALLTSFGRAVSGEGAAAQRARDGILVALLGGLLSFAVVAVNAFALVTAAPEQRQLVSHAWAVLRTGSLDVSFTLGMTPSTAMIAASVSLSVVAVLGWASTSVIEPQRRHALAVGASLALAGVLLVVLGDDWISMCAGALLTGVASLSLVAEANRAAALRGFALGRLSDAALLAAGGLLVWGLGGDFIGGGEYLPDFRPRLVTVQLGKPNEAPKPGPDGRPKATREQAGSISMSALPGSTLSIGGASLCLTDADGRRGGVGIAGRPCREVARSPFARLPLPAALHDIEIWTGPGTQDLIVEKVRIGATPETLLTTAGSTLVLREMRDQLAIRDASGAHALRSLLGKRRVFGQPLLGVVGMLIALAVALRVLLAAAAVSARPFERAGSFALVVLVAGTELVVGAALLARTDFLLALLPRTAMALALVAALALSFAAARAAHALGAKSALSGIAIAELCLAVMALAGGAHTGGVLVIAVHALGLAAFGVCAGAALEVAAAAGRDVGADGRLAELGGLGKQLPELARASSLAALVVAGAPLPCVGVFWGRDAALQASAAFEGLGFAGWVAAGALVLGSALTSFAVWRVHYLVFVGGGRRGDVALVAPKWSAKSALGLALLALAIGALALPGYVLSTSAPAPLESWLARFGSEQDPALVPDQSVRFAILGVGFAAALAGWAAARARYGAARPQDWLSREPERIAHGLLGAPARAFFDSALSSPLLALSERINGLEAALDGLLYGMPKAGRVSVSAPTIEREPSEPEAAEPSEPSEPEAAEPSESSEPEAAEPSESSEPEESSASSGVAEPSASSEVAAPSAGAPKPASGKRRKRKKPKGKRGGE